MASFNMRSFVLALGIAGIASGCDVGNTVPTGSDPDAPPAGVDAPVVATPKVAVTLDRATISTELLATELIAATITGTGGFAGPVNLVATVVNAADNTPVVGATAVFNQPTVTLTANGSTVSAITLKLPNNAPAAVKVNVAATSSAAPVDVSSALTVANQVTFKVTNDGTNKCKYPANSEVRVGTKIRFLLTEAVANGITIHSGGPIPHEDINEVFAVGQSYDFTPIIVGTSPWYCHNVGPNLEIDDADPATLNPRIKVVAL